MKRELERRLSAMEASGGKRMIIASAYGPEVERVAGNHAGPNDLVVLISKPSPCEPIIRVLAA